MAKAPADFPFYPADFLSDENVRVMTLEERGAYITLLCHCWIEGSIPDEDWRIARLLGIDEKLMASLWPGLEPCFENIRDLPERLINPRLDREREQALEQRAALSEAGSRGAVNRWGKARRKKSTEARRPGHGQAITEAMSKTDEKYGVGSIPTTPFQDSKETAVEQPTPDSRNDNGTVLAKTFISMWNASAKRAGWRVCRRLGPGRLKALRARTRDPDWCENWQEAMVKAEAVPAFSGQNDHGWVATPDWFLRPDTLNKIMEGQYDDWGRSTGGRRTQRSSFFDGLDEKGGGDA